MSDLRKKVIKKGLKTIANNGTANNFANKALKVYAEKSDSKVIKAIANNPTANKVANSALKSIANNPKTVDIAADIIEKKFKK